MTKLTKREKRMLYLLGCFTLVVVGVYLLILPAITTQANLSAQLKELEAQQNVRVEAIRKMGTLSGEINTLKSTMERTCARYAPPMYTEQLDRQYTSMLRRYNANPVNLEIGEVTQTPMPHYRASLEQEAPALDAGEVAPIESYMATVNTEGTIIDPIPAPPPEDAPPAISAEDATIDTLLLKINATMKPADAMAFLAELSADPTV
ncbi:MAG: type II secretion system protein GspM, partial [Angelakisella sp.]